MTGDQRYVISVRLVGGVRREKPRLKTFMLSVLWSDEAEVIIYRSFQDFRSFHAQLKKRFPNFNPFRKNDRKIPKFSGKARRRSLQQTGSRKSVSQMNFLQTYCEDLLRCDQTVTLSSEVTRFFTPRDHDLQTDFTKNTVMILTSDEAPDAAGGARSQQVGSVTQPFVTLTYRCLAPYETRDTKNRTFKAATDDKLDVLIKDPAGWWLVESEDKRLAWFPAPYLELCDEGEEEEGGSLAGSLYCAVRNYSTSQSDEVGVAIGSLVEVLRRSDDGWWLVRCGGRVGYLPSMYLQPYSNPRRLLHGLHLHNSALTLTSGGARGSQPVQNQDPGFRRGSAAPERLARAQSLDVLSESWLRDGAAASASSSSHSNDSIFSSFSSSTASSSSSDPTRCSRSSSTGSAGSGGAELAGSGSTGSGSAGSGSAGSGSAGSGSAGSVGSSSAGSGSAGSVGSSSAGSSSAGSGSTGSVGSSSAGSGSTGSGSAGSGSAGSGTTGSSSSSPAPCVPRRPDTQEILQRCSTMTRKAALASRTRLQQQADPVHSRL